MSGRGVCQWLSLTYLGLRVERLERGRIIASQHADDKIR